MKKLFSEKLERWYEENKRALPWRSTTDPYKIWLSEIILQQTRVVQGLPYYEAFVKKYPRINNLAAAPQDEVLRLWQGLGYYSRARNLHACAKEVVEKYAGKFPDSYQQLLTLRGVGSYTAAAIASFAFNEPVAVVDGNVFRVLARVFGIEHDIATTKGKKFFFEKANELISKTKPGLFNQALMEFGALQCTPKNPACTTCTFSKSCIARAQNMQHLLPVKADKKAIKKRYFNYLLIENGNKMLMRKRNPGDIWQGLYDFLLIETPKATSLAKLKKRHKELNGIDALLISGIYKHVLSHQQLFARFIRAKVKSTRLKTLEKEFALKAYSIKQIEQLPKPILVNRYLKDAGLLP